MNSSIRSEFPTLGQIEAARIIVANPQKVGCSQILVPWANTILANAGVRPGPTKDIRRLQQPQCEAQLSWHSVVIYGPHADYAAKIKPGSLVSIECEMASREFEREVHGVKVQWPVAEIVASSITAIHTKDKTHKGAAA